MKDEENIEELIERVSALAEALDKRGFALVIVKKPRPHNFVKMYNPKHGFVDEQTRFGATRCKEFREKAGLRIVDVMNDLGVQRPIVTRMEDDNVTHTYKSIKRFADYYGVSVEDLLK